jgi:hypothetical protein
LYPSAPSLLPAALVLPRLALLGVSLLAALVLAALLAARTWLRERRQFIVWPTTLAR